MFQIKIVISSIIALFSITLFAQEATVTINSDNMIQQVLDLKNEINQTQNAIKIQIYSGSRNGAEKSFLEFKSNFPNFTATMMYETPSYKIWVGNYRTQIQADRALVEIRKKYKSAFSFTPKMKKAN